ncbi:MAG: phage tail protein [Emcibacter sp.]|nr:phage tail protein [Emcibacter sp.]
MSDPFAGEIRMFAGNYAPRGWAFTDGQLLAMSQNDALFSLLGTIYGGDGRTTFGLPDLRGRIPVHAGQAPGMPNIRLGERGGHERVVLSLNELPAHNHRFEASLADGAVGNPEGLFTADSPDTKAYLDLDGIVPNFEELADKTISSVGGGESHNNLMPFLCVSYIIALFGIFPQRH